MKKWEEILMKNENKTKTNNLADTVPIWEKANLTVREAAEYSNIGQHKIRELMKLPNCNFVINVGNSKQLIKRKQFENFLSRMITI